MEDSDLSLQCEQQKLQINQLKLMIREKDDVLQNKDKEIQVHFQKFSKVWSTASEAFYG